MLCEVLVCSNREASDLLKDRSISRKALPCRARLYARVNDGSLAEWTEAEVSGSFYRAVSHMIMPTLSSVEFASLRPEKESRLMLVVLNSVPVLLAVN
jgi:hypothetical protein